MPVNVLVIGTGLIGGSFAKGLKENGQAKHVAGYSRNFTTLQEGVALGVIDEALTEPQLPKAINQADVIMLGVPTLSVGHFLPMIGAHKKANAVVSDAASVKGDIVDAVAKALGNVPEWFVPGHPIAGSEKSGISASNSDLFKNHKIILTPLENTLPEAIALITKLWQSLGAEVVNMSVTEHDHVLAATSHLPHALAFTLVDTLRQMEDSLDIFRFAAGGFRDFTRIASSHPTMWHDIMLANKAAILSVMGDFREGLDNLENAIKDDDSEAILAMFERAKQSRDDFAKLLDEQKSPKAFDKDKL